jgi:hypothetical protein
MRKINKLQRTAVLALSVALSIAGVSYAQVMDKVPADALVVIKVANLAQTSAKVAKLAETLGVNGFVPQLNDPLGALKKQLKISGGLKDDGELAFVYLDPKGAEEGKSVIILVPTTDYAALVGNIEGATKDGNLTVTKGQDGEDMFLADWGGYAAASPMKELVAAAPSKKVELHTRAKSELDGNDLTLFANFEALRGPLTADFAKNREKAKSEMLDQMKAKGEVPEKYYPVAEAAFDQVFNVIDAFLRDADAATIGIKIGENGISQNVVTQFKEGSYLGKLTDDLHNDGGTLLTNLPTGKYLVYGGAAGLEKVTGQLIDDLIGPVLKVLPPDEELKMVPEYIASLKALSAEVKGASFGMVAPQGGIGQEAVIQYVSTLKGDSGKITEQFKAMNDKYASLINKVMGEAQGVEIKQSYAPAVKEIDGVKFDSITTEFVGDSPVANQQRQMMQVMYGAPKVDMYIGNAGSAVLSYVGANEDSVKALIAAAKGNTSPLADVETVKSVSKELPSKRVAEAYIQVDEIFALAVRAANQFQLMQGNVALAPDLQPVGVSLSSDKSALEFKWYITNDLMQALVTGALQTYQNMQGGGGNGGGGL